MWGEGRVTVWVMYEFSIFVVTVLWGLYGLAMCGEFGFDQDTLEVGIFSEG